MNACPLSLILMAKYGEIGITFMSSDDVNSTYILNAAALLVVLPMIIVFAFTQRYFIESVDKVGVKG